MKTQIAKYLVLIEYFENVYTAHSNLEIQYKPYQNSNSRFHRSRKTTLNFVKNSKKTQKTQSHPDKEKQRQRHHTFWFK